MTALPVSPLRPVRSAQAAWRDTARELSNAGHPAVGLAVTQGLVLTYAQARACGLAERDLRRLVRRHEWTLPRYGVLSPLPAAAEGPSGVGPEIAAAAAALAWTDAVISHSSAAALHCLPLLRSVGPPRLTGSRGQHQACSRRDVRLHIATLAGEETSRWFGAPVTNAERTVVDLARASGLRDGLVAADAALHEGLTSADALARAVDRQAGWPGVRTARRIVDLADGRAESPLESLARLCLVAGGLPTPELQVWVETEGGWYRVDMLYERERVVVEADGLLKYRTDPAALIAEKRRQEYLERAGYLVVRVLWDDVVRHPARTVARVRTALAARSLALAG